MDSWLQQGWGYQSWCCSLGRKEQNRSHLRPRGGPAYGKAPLRLVPAVQIGSDAAVRPRAAWPLRSGRAVSEPRSEVPKNHENMPDPAPGAQGASESELATECFSYQMSPHPRA
eukprot:748005-Hanusia_phi.AAC.1